MLFRSQIALDRKLENGMAVSIGRLRPDSQYTIKFVCLSHNTLRGAAGGNLLTAELACRVAGLTLQSDSAVSPALSAAVFE